MTLVTCHDDEVRLRRDAIRFPVELGFRAEALETWPAVEGRLEYVEGRLLYMTPCGDRQGSVVADIVYLLKAWSRQHPAFVVRTNEVGMRLGPDIRAADAAVWRRDELGPPSGGIHRVPPVLAVEVAGLDEAETDLRRKALWYLTHGVRVIWLVLPESHEVLVMSAVGDALDPVVSRHGCGQSLLPQEALPGLVPGVDEFFSELP
jgi:Uma2 family endonuclease